MKESITALKKGFTVIEMVIYAGLLVLFLGVLSNLFLSSLDIKVESETASYTGQDARFVLLRLNYDIKRADNIITPALGESLDTLIIDIGGVNHTYSFAGGKIKLDGENLNGSETEVSTVSFERIGNLNGKNTIKVSFTMDGKNYETTIGLR